VSGAPYADASGVVLDSYQRDLVKKALKYSVLVIEKSRRIGISWVMAYVACLIAMPAIKPDNVYYMGYSFEMTRQFIDDCANFLRAFNVLSVEPYEFFEKDGDKEIKSFRIDLPSGKSIVALTSSPRNIRSKQGVVMLDEAALHDDLNAVIDAATPLMMLGGRLIIWSTHYGTDNDFNALIEDIRAKRRAGHVERITFDDALKGGFFKRLCKIKGDAWSAEAEAKYDADIRALVGEAASQELDVIPANGSGVWLSRATIEAASTKDFPVYRLACPDGFQLRPLEWRTAWVAEWIENNLWDIRERLDQQRLTYFGQDYARSADLSVIAVGQYDQWATLNVPFIIEMRNVPSREQLQVWDYILARCTFACGKLDARGNGQDVAAYLQDHYGHDQFEAVMATQNTYLERMPRLKARLEDRTMLIPWAEGVIDDLRLVKLVKGIPMIVDRSADKADGSAKKTKRHGDVAIALMNLSAAADEDFAPFDFTEVKPGDDAAIGDFNGQYGGGNADGYRMDHVYGGSY
jgi:phage FluMu gp28-like protein